MGIAKAIADWLEGRWVTPAYGGWLLAGLTICFLAAAANTMVGWLYAIGGISIALLAIAAVMPARSLVGLQVKRSPIAPVSAGDRLTISIEIENQTLQPKTLLEVRDILPFVLGEPAEQAIDIIPPQGVYNWVYYYQTKKRGIYRWHRLDLRTATPLGLFWCRRSRPAEARAIVYPQVLPLNNCPIIDRMGEKDALKFKSDRRGFQNATEGLTRALRPYRVGDPFRLIHWRTSARHGELLVRELEVMTGGQEVIICLDTAFTWNSDDFEQAVIAAASLYFYASRRQMNAKLWTAATGLLQGYRVVLEALAATNFNEEAKPDSYLPDMPAVCLTQNPGSLKGLPIGSRWVLWRAPESESTDKKLVNNDYPGLTIEGSEELATQLQKRLW